jgi:hypothetical protein
VENGENLLMDFSPFSILCDCAAESIDALACFISQNISKKIEACRVVHSPLASY